MNLSLWEMTLWGPRGRRLSLWPEGGALGQFISFPKHHLGILQVSLWSAPGPLSFCLASVSPIAVLSSSCRITVRATYIILTFPVPKRNTKTTLTIYFLSPCIGRMSLRHAINIKHYLTHRCVFYTHSLSRFGPATFPVSTATQGGGLPRGRTVLQSPGVLFSFPGWSSPPSAFGQITFAHLSLHSMRVRASCNHGCSQAPGEAPPLVVPLTAVYD